MSPIWSELCSEGMCVVPSPLPRAAWDRLYAAFDCFASSSPPASPAVHAFNNEAKLWQEVSGLRSYYSDYFAPYFRDTRSQAGKDNKRIVQLCVPYYQFLHDRSSPLLANEPFIRLIQGMMAALSSAHAVLLPVLAGLKEVRPDLHRRLVPDDAFPPVALRLLSYYRDQHLATNAHVDKSAMTVFLDSDDPTREKLVFGNPLAAEPQRLSDFQPRPARPGEATMIFGAALREAGYRGFPPTPHAVLPFEGTIRHCAIFFWLLRDHDMAAFDTKVEVLDDLYLARPQPSKRPPKSTSSDAADPTFASRQASAYDDLLPAYEALHDTCQPLRQAVLDRVLAGIPNGASALDVGCGAGSYLALLKHRRLEAEGIDVSPKMARAARARAGCPVVCADFLVQEWSRRYDLVFAQAFVHLFPKSTAASIVHRLKALARQRIYLSTSITGESSEGWEHKDGAVRFRSRYTVEEFAIVVSMATADGQWTAETFELTDPHGKHWIQVILDRKAV